MLEDHFLPLLSDLAHEQQAATISQTPKYLWH